MKLLTPSPYRWRMCISNFTPQIDPGTLPTASAMTTFPLHGPFFQVQQAGGNFREEIKQCVRTDRDDCRNFESENQHGEQQYAAPHAAQADENADDKANQDFGC